MSTTLKDWIIIISAVIIMALTLKLGCSSPFPNLEVEPRIETIIKSDTIWTKDTLIKFKSIIKPKWDTIYKIDTLVEGISLDDLNHVRIYNDSLIDSNLTIFSDIKVLGILSQLDLSYKLNPKPSLITNNITTTITNTEFRPNKVQIYTGLQLGGNKTSFNISPFININVKKVTIQYNYGVLNNSHNLGVGYKIFNSKK